MIPEAIRLELEQVLRSNYKIDQVVDRGLSRAIVYRVESSVGCYALKRWPITVSRERVLSQHQFQSFLSDSGMTFIPSLEKFSNNQTIFEIDRSLWDMSCWRNGEPLSELGEINDDQLCEVISTVARMHRRSNLFKVMDCVPPGFNERQKKLSDFVAHSQFVLLHSIAQNTGSSSQVDLREGLREVFRLAAMIAPRLMEPMSELATTPARCSWVVRDLWRDHVLFVGNKVNGVIDFGAARLDHPWLDLSRLLGTLLIDSDPRWETACQMYSNILISTPAYVEQVKLLHRVSTVLSAIHWVEWVASGLFDPSDRASQPVRRIHEIYRQLRDIEMNGRSLVF